MFADGTCQPVVLEDAEAGGEQREGVNEVHAEVEDALEQHHHQPQLHHTGTQRSQKQTHPSGSDKSRSHILKRRPEL